MYRRESDLQRAVARYIKRNYPDVYFTSDASGNNTGSKFQRGYNKATRNPSRGWADLIILEPRANWNGLILELKLETPFRQDGELKAGEHLLEQWEFLMAMKSKDYLALFVWGWELTIETIDDYMKQPKTYPNNNNQ